MWSRDQCHVKAFASAGWADFQKAPEQIADLQHTHPCASIFLVSSRRSSKLQLGMLVNARDFPGWHGSSPVGAGCCAIYGLRAVSVKPEIVNGVE
jgi:hypothetical protein